LSEAICAARNALRQKERASNRKLGEQLHRLTNARSNREKHKTQISTAILRLKALKVPVNNRVSRHLNWSFPEFRQLRLTKIAPRAFGNAE
jgi:hypothetical protein